MLYTACTINEDNALHQTLGKAIKPISRVIEAQEKSANTVNSAVLLAYLRDFTMEAKSRGIDINYVYDGEIIMKFVDFDGPSAFSGISNGRKNNKVEIYINSNSWDWRSDVAKRTLVYHELGHDIFNFGHKKNRLMHGGTLSLANDIDDGTVNESEIMNEFWADAKKKKG